jgi:hypothetical protein
LRQPGALRHTYDAFRWPQLIPVSAEYSLPIRPPRNASHQFKFLEELVIHHEQEIVCVRVRGIGAAVERRVLRRRTIRHGRRCQSDARSRHGRAEGQRSRGAQAQFNDQKNKQFRDRDLYVYCFNIADGKFTAFQNDMMIGVDIRELKLPPDDPIGKRAYDAVHDVPEGNVVTIEYSFPKPGTKAAAIKQTLEARVGNQACGERPTIRCARHNHQPRVTCAETARHWPRRLAQTSV